MRGPAATPARPACRSSGRSARRFGDSRSWSSIGDAYRYGPAPWAAPILDDGAWEREVGRSRGDWIEAWSGERVRGGEGDGGPGPLHVILVCVRSGSVVITYAAEHVASGLGDVDERERRLEPTL